MPKYCPQCDIPLQFENVPECPNCGFQLRPSLTRVMIRNPYLAVILSFFFVGWGQWYNGKTSDGLKFLVAFAGTSVLMYLFTQMESSQPMTTQFVLIILGALAIGIWGYGMYNAYRTAENINRNKDSFSKRSPLFWMPVVVLVIIIAAIISVYAFGMGAYFQPAKVVTVSAIRQGDNIIIAYQGGSGSSQVSKFKYGNGALDHDWNSPKVGERVTLYGDQPGKDHVLVSVVFMDGSGYIVLDMYV
jgi:hypothetical protein